MQSGAYFSKTKHAIAVFTAFIINFKKVFNSINMFFGLQYPSNTLEYFRISFSWQKKY